MTAYPSVPPAGGEYTDTGSLANLVTTAYDRKVRLALRSMPTFRAVADTKAVQQSHPGASVVFAIHHNLAPATTPLNEVDEPDGTSFANPTRITVNLQEYGNFTVVTKALKAFAYDSALDSNVADTIAYNQADSVDRIIESVLAGTSNVIDKTEEAETTISMGDIRRIVAKLRSASVPTFDGVNYVCYVHPEVAHDLRTETNDNSWRTPQNYVNPAGLLAGEIGTFENVRFVETPRVGITGSGLDKVYNTYVVGKEALAEAVAEEFHVVLNGRVVDPLDRKTAMGWYGIAGWNRFRPESLWKIQSTSSVADPDEDDE